MDELEFAEQVLLVAEHLRILPGNREIINRFIVSKLYYAAHHLGRLLLKKRGENPDAWSGEVHRRVIDELLAKFVTTRILTSETVRHLDILRAKRVKADYFLNRRFQREEIDKIFRLYREFLDEVRNILPAI